MTSMDKDIDPTELRDYEIKGETVYELRRIEKSLMESFSLLSSDLDDMPSPFYMIPVVINVLVLEHKEKNLYRKHGAFLLFLWETTDTLRVSAMLALGFRYSAALSLLRLGLESLIRGAFFDSIAKEEYRMTIKEKRVKKFVDTELEHKMNQNSELQAEMEERSLVLVKAFEDYQSNKDKWFLLPKVADMIATLEHWMLLEAIPEGEVNDMYGILSNAVHLSPYYMNAIMRATFLGNPYVEPTYIPEPMKLFLHLFKIVIDISLVVSFNVLKHYYSPEEQCKIIDNMLPELGEYEEAIPFLWKLLGEISERHA